MKRKAFTLIELLVVIAIIAILAAILFPVFAQAKNAAKKTTSLSNTKQVGTGTILYINDYDDAMPPLYWFNPIDLTLPTSQGFYYYPLLLRPYTKNDLIFLCPNDREDDAQLRDPQGRGRFDSNSSFRDYLIGANPSYGYNYRYLNTMSVSFSFGGRPVLSFSGVSATSFNSPSQTLVFAEATMKDRTVPGVNGAPSGTVRNAVGYSRIEPPFSVPTPVGAAPYMGWTGTFPDARSQGQLWGRFQRNSVLAVWADGHAKTTPISRLRGTGTTEQQVNRFWNGLGDNQ
jgi:prepilin-type N-terminal cleavage/methylation domain-containing protein